MSSNLNSNNSDFVINATGTDNDLVFQQAGVEKGRVGAGGFGKVLQVVHVSDGEMNSAAATMPDDNSIPQITEGFEVMSLAITPKSSTSRLIIDVTVQHAASSGDTLTMALFVDSVADSIGAIGERTPNASLAKSNSFKVQYQVSSLSELTFSVRIGSVSGTAYFNWLASARLYGGVASSSITITEIGA